MFSVALGIFLLFLASSDGLLSPKVDQLCSDYWDWRMKDMPQFATFVGIHTYDDMLDDMSEESYLIRYNKCQEFKTRTLEIQPTLTEEADIVNIRVLQYELDTYMDNYDIRGYYLPINNLEGIQLDMIMQFNWMLNDSMEALNKMISRLYFIPTQIEQILALMEAGVASNITYNLASMDHLQDEISEYDVAEARDSPFWQFFETENLPTDFSELEIRDIQTRAARTIDERVSPAFRKLLLYVVNDYLMRPDIAITSINRGKEFYQQLIYYHTSTNKTAQEIHDIGIAEVARITEKMMNVIVEAGYEGMTVQEFSNMIREDHKNFFNNSDDLMTEYEDITYNIVPKRLPMIFKNIPTAELKVVADPSPAGPGAFYLSGSYDGLRPGVFSVNTYYLDLQPKYNMITLSLHEGNPGHHFQGSYAIESDDYPYFRRVMEDRNYGIAPSRFPMYSYYMEGWALYSESLGFDMQLYDDPLERYGHYSAENYRACRLVVDTGMHALGWTRDEAIEFMLNNTASSRNDLENEVDRYITWPGQALAYKMGQLKFSELRKASEEALGSLFDIKEFHDVVLRSLGPMDLVANEVEKWIHVSLSKLKVSINGENSTQIESQKADVHDEDENTSDNPEDDENGTSIHQNDKSTKPEEKETDIFQKEENILNYQQNEKYDSSNINKPKTALNINKNEDNLLSIEESEDKNKDISTNSVKLENSSNYLQEANISNNSEIEVNNHYLNKLQKHVLNNPDEKKENSSNVHLPNNILSNFKPKQEHPLNNNLNEEYISNNVQREESVLDIPKLEEKSPTMPEKNANAQNSNLKEDMAITNSENVENDSNNLEIDEEASNILEKKKISSNPEEIDSNLKVSLREKNSLIQVTQPEEIDADQHDENDQITNSPNRRHVRILLPFFLQGPIRQ